jgi:acetyltransferase
MSVRNLEFLFRPRSVAVVGASNRRASVGSFVMRNLLRGGFDGPVIPVNPRQRSVAGVLACPDVPSLPIVPDLAVVCTPVPTVVGLVDQLGRAGVRAAIVITAGLGRETDTNGRRLDHTLLEIAGRHRMRILGPNCLGLLVSGIGLNASFAHVEGLAGDLAFVSQSGAICTAVLDWARGSDIGFSHFVSLGDSLDVDVGDVLDYLAADEETRAILLYVESVGRARKFMSAARAASRNKPVIVIKAGRGAEGARAAASHTGALAGGDDVHSAAFERAGMLRVDRLDEMFDAAETLTRSRHARTERLLVLTNGGGLGVMATDYVMAQGGGLAELSPELVNALDAVLPANWSRANPIDIIGDASGERYEKALSLLLAAEESDPILILHAPTALASSEEAARTIARVVRDSSSRRIVLTSWVGRESAESARRIFRQAGIATYDTPENAISAFVHMRKHSRSQAALLEVPPALPREITPRREDARRVIEGVLAEGRALLTEPEAKAVLAAYGLPVVETRIASDAEAAGRLAEEIGFPVALKILSSRITHKTDVGGVVLDLESRKAVVEAARAMAVRLEKHVPDAPIEGFTVQRMARRVGAHELIVGASCDPVFGPVLLFGQGGIAVEVIADRAVSLPPLNVTLARELVERTRVARLLRGYRGRPPADLDAIHLALVRLSQIVTELPEVVEIDVNPLFADAQGVLALDARMRVERAVNRDRLAIRPYPDELEETIRLADGLSVTLRPIRPEDEPAHQRFLAQIEPEDVRFRFFDMVRRVPHSQMARYTQIDYDREMAFVAVRDEGGVAETLGVVRAVTDPDNERAEFAIVVRSDCKGRGLGHALLEKLVRYFRARGTQQIVGQVLPGNTRMLGLAKSLGFALHERPDEDVVETRLALRRDENPTA